MTEHTLRIRPVDNQPKQWEITLNGTDIANCVTGFVVRVDRAGMIPRVTLQLATIHGLDPDSELTTSDIQLGASERAILQQLGWTPPA